MLGVLALSSLFIMWLPATGLGSAVGERGPRETGAIEPLLAESSAGTSTTLGLKVNRPGAERPTLDARGSRPGPGNSGKFGMSADISRIPCAGEYVFGVALENAGNGNSQTFTAVIELFDPALRPAGARCGVAPPRLGGHLDVSLTVLEHEPFSLEGDRSNGGSFKGKLTLAKFLECNKDYRLGIELDLAGWRRRADFKVRVLEFEATYQRRRIPSQRC